MERRLPARKGRRSRFRKFFNAILVIILLACLGFMTMITLDWIDKMPNTERVELDFGEVAKPVFIRGEMQPLSAMKQQDAILLPLTLIKEQLDPYIMHEPETNSVIITTENKVFRMQSGQLDALMNNEPFQLHFPVMEEEGEVYVPADPLLELYGLVLRESAETGAVFVQQAGEILQHATVRQAEKDKQAVVYMRTEATVKAPIGMELQAGENVRILGEPADAEEWYHIQLDSGYIGYVKKDQLQLEEPQMIPVPHKEASFIPWKPLGGKINLTWEHVIRRTPDPSGFMEMPGLNVVSPTWFSLGENENGIPFVQNIADASYVEWAHKQGYQVWALFSNSFDPDLTTKALSRFDYRQGIIKQLVSMVHMYDLQGINIDFENVYLKDKDQLTQFVRELTPYLHEAGAVVSIDVTIRDGSDMWSRFADRKALGEVVDYMMVMTYDEHWRTSPIAGSVASLPWTEKGIVDIMEKDFVPADKLLLGVPFYTYEWTEENGKVTGPGRARFMKDVQAVIQEKELTPVFLPDVGQHYIEYEEDNKKIRIWIEDEVSMKARAELVKKHNLAGIASWRRGFETEEIWHVIKDTLEKRP